MPMFDPGKDKITRDVVWVRFTALPMEFWDEETIFRMARGLGKPVSVDLRTLRHEYGYFAVALIDIDFSQPLGRILVDGEENEEIFVQQYEILNRPSFCDYCKSIGHKKSDCRTKKYDDLKDKADEETDPEIKKSIEADMEDLKNFWQKERIPKDDGKDKAKKPTDPSLRTILEKDQANKPGDDPKTMKNPSILEIATGKHTHFLEKVKLVMVWDRVKKRNDGANLIERNDGASQSEKRNDGAESNLRNDGEETAESVHDSLRKEDDVNLEAQEMEAFRNYEAMKEATRQRTEVAASSPAANIQAPTDDNDDASFSEATKTSRRSTPSKSLENLTVSNRFETGNEETDEVVIETNLDTVNTQDQTQPTNNSKVAEDDAINLELLAKKEQ
ncbi:uncharacterized protein LOC113312863 [Papaver somniferum]|uniref:uncharacterized protein LOC113312863 n=1 Tax=Papaver somniferum TaxID=3469 RepID=UPI000E6F5EA5|nr:uncharacterized protein LOC113312863 [Papaver somniferum]